MHGPKCEEKINFWLWGGGGAGEACNDQTGLLLLSNYPLPISMYMQYDMNLKYEKQIVHILEALGGGGGHP